MDYNSEKNLITIFGKSEKLDVLANKLAALSGDQVYSMFSARGIAVPRRMNCMALTSVINKKLKQIHASELSKDYFNRLKYYNAFSELQLFSLFCSICNTKEQFKEYRVNLFKLILLNYVGLNLVDGEIKYLKDLKKLPVEGFDQYFQYISSMCQEQENTFDGQDMKVLRDLLVNTASGQEIIELGRKYGIEISTSLKKSELIEFMKHYLEQAGELTKTLEYEIDSSTVSGLNSLCKKYRIPMSSNMTKNDMVTYLFYVLSQCEITQTSVKRIEFTKEYEPLEFTIDMTVFKGFIPDDTRRIIHFENEDEEEFDKIEDVEAMEEAILSLDEQPEKSYDSNVGDVIAKAKKESVKSTIAETPIVEEVQEEKLPHDAQEYTEEQEPNEVVEETAENVNTLEEITEEVLPEAEQDEIQDALDSISEKNHNEEPQVSDEQNKEGESEKEASVPTTQIAEIVEESVEEEKDDTAQSGPKIINGLSMDDVRINKEFGNDKLKKKYRGPWIRILFVAIGAVVIAAVAFVLWALLK